MLQALYFTNMLGMAIPNKTPIPPPALEYNQIPMPALRHGSNCVWISKTAAAVGIIPRVRGEIYTKRNKNQCPCWNYNGLDEQD